MMNQETKRNEVKVIDARQVLGKDFKIYGTVENPLFLAKDVASWLDMDTSNASRMIKNVDEEECITTRHNMTNATFLTEDGLYEVLMQSRKPIAKQFKKEVKKILKQIRLTGGYVNNDDMFINTYLPFADDTTKLLFKSTLETVRKQNTIIEEQKPKVEYHDTVLYSNKFKPTSDISKDFGISAQQLNKILNELHVQFKKNKNWRLYHEYDWLINEQYADYKIDEYGQQLRWSELGRKFIIKKLLDTEEYQDVIPDMYKSLDLNSVKVVM